jgi:hypothetical protein
MNIKCDAEALYYKKFRPREKSELQNEVLCGLLFNYLISSSFQIV